MCQFHAGFFQDDINFYWKRKNIIKFTDACMLLRQYAQTVNILNRWQHYERFSVYRSFCCLSFSFLFRSPHSSIPFALCDFYSFHSSSHFSACQPFTRIERLAGLSLEFCQLTELESVVVYFIFYQILCVRMLLK